MKKQLSRAFLLLSSILLLMGMTFQDLPQNLYEQLQRQTRVSQSLQLQNRVLTEQVASLTLELERVTLERNEGKFVLDTVDTLTTGVTVTAWANPKHIRYVRDACKRWEYVVGDLKKTEKLACWQFVYCRLMATGLNANFRSLKPNKDGSYDNGIGDLNDIVLDSIQKDMDNDKRCPDWIRKGNWKNIDKSIYGLYIWINQRRKMHMTFAEMEFYQWQLYAKIKD